MAVATGPTLDEIQQDRRGARDRVLLRPVRRHVRRARARSSFPPRISTTSSTTAPGSPASPPARSARCRATPTSPRSRTSASFTPVPWQPNLARFACDITVEGEPWPYCPRTILRNVSSRGAKELGYEFKIGLELEYFLVRRRDDGSIEIADAHDTLEKPCYDMAGPDAALRLPDHGLEVLQRARLGQLRERPRGRERPVRAELHLRRRARQLRPRDLLPLHGAHARRAARDDRDVHAEAVHEPDRQRLPLPHVAVGRRRRTCSSTRTTRAGSGSRSSAYHFIGGLKKHARAYSAVTAPTVNSYKRLKLGSTTSGATWSPVWISYGYNNRTQMLRIPGPGRIEDRTIDGSCNPYLAAAAVLAAGPRRDRERARRRRAERGEPLHGRATTSSSRAGSQTLPGEPARGDAASSSGTTSCARRSAAAATRTTSTTTSASSATSGTATTSRSRRGRSAST